MTSDTQLKRFRARWALPVNGDPIYNALIETAGGRIVTVRALGGGESVGNCNDLGDVAIMPALVNAHTHLEFSDLQQPIGQRGMSIADWLPEVVRRRREQQLTEADREAAIVAGLKESMRSGVRTIGEIATQPWPADAVTEVIVSSNGDEPSLTVFGEVLGLSPERSSGLLNWWDESISTLHRPLQAAISPHAPYSVPDDLLADCVQRGQAASCPVAMHFAESIEEREFVETGGGAMFKAFNNLGLSGLEQFPTKSSMLDRLQVLAGARRALIVHGNYLTEEEIGLISKHRQKMTVVYCPRTHDFFDHKPHPVADLLAAGISVALGTDSRASNPDLSLLKELQFLLHHRQDLPPGKVLEMATGWGAESLGYRDLGYLRPGAVAQFVAFETVAKTQDQLWQSLHDCEGFITGTA